MDIDMPIYSLRSFQADAGLGVIDIHVNVSDHDEAVLRNQVMLLKNIHGVGIQRQNNQWNRLWSALQQKKYRDLTILLEQPGWWKVTIEQRQNGSLKRSKTERRLNCRDYMHM